MQRIDKFPVLRTLILATALLFASLPGALGAGIVMAVALIASVVVHLRRERRDIAREHALGGIVAALLFWLAVAQSDASRAEQTSYVKLSVPKESAAGV